MKYFAYFIVILALLALNLGLFPYIRLWGAEPNLLLLTVVIFALEKGEYDFFFVALCAGIFLDIYSGFFFGGFTLTFLLLGYLLHLLVSKVLMMELGAKALVIIISVCTLLSLLMVWLYNWAAFKFGYIPDVLDFHTLEFRILPEIFYNLLIGYPLYLFIIWFKEKIADFFYFGKKQ